MNKLWVGFKNYRFFSANKSFFQLGVVWFTFSIILIIAIVLTYGVTINENYVGCISAKCYETFIDSYKLPIGILSLLIPIGAIYAAQHRSEISIAQIKSIESQNKFANYYKHLEEFNNLLTNNKCNETFLSVSKLHKQLFPGSRDGIFEIDEDTTKYLNNRLLLTHQNLKKLEKYIDSIKIDDVSDNSNLIKLLLTSHYPIVDIRKYLGFKDINYPLHSLKRKLKINEVYFSDIYQDITNTCQILEVILSFDQEYELLDELIMLAQMQYEQEKKDLSVNNPIKLKLRSSLR
ncbi:hypothetical protein [Thalassotalea hakodatensis]|uniref:hypothetical protein n=1 Tax=Thalassotalea hakodatensis TaxID=3030492 RepID=UPI00257349DF|nr:hypothetical protein [Thalassotalea hakodatensis]